MKHTPGPWRVLRTEQHPGNENEAVTFIQIPKLCYDLCFVKGILTEDEHAANARLIAAAPELLAALQDLMSITKTQYSQMATYKLCKEIVSKATSHE